MFKIGPKVEMTSLVDIDWVAGRLGDPGLRIVDATWYLPNAGRTGIEDYQAGHIPGAVFWDIDAVSDPQSPLPHMLPVSRDFESHMARLGISNHHRVVVYDNVGMMTSPRVWWTLRVFGHEAVSVLDGGLAAWREGGRSVSSEEPVVDRADFRAEFNAPMVRSLASVMAAVGSCSPQILDARSEGRFTGIEPEPRPGCRSGHIPGSLNLPFNRLIDSKTSRFHKPEELERLFVEAGLDMQEPVITSCGSGVTACVLAFSMHLLGKEDVSVYDGSWSEWGTQNHLPLEV